MKKLLLLLLTAISIKAFSQPTQYCLPLSNNYTWRLAEGYVLQYTYDRVITIIDDSGNIVYEQHADSILFEPDYKKAFQTLLNINISFARDQQKNLIDRSGWRPFMGDTSRPSLTYDADSGNNTINAHGLIKVDPADTMTVWYENKVDTIRNVNSAFCLDANNNIHGFHTAYLVNKQRVLHHASWWQQDCVISDTWYDDKHHKRTMFCYDVNGDCETQRIWVGVTIK